MTGEAFSRDTLMGLLEAARWAPSSFNSQPWRFVYAHRDTPAWQPLFDTLNEINRSWAHRASALVLVVSKTRWVAPGQAEESALGSASLDAGAAWFSIAMQAHLAGLCAHAIGGFDRDLARRTLGIPEDCKVEVMVALGKQGPKEQLSDALQARESPNARKPLAELAFEGRYAG